MRSSPNPTAVEGAANSAALIRSWQENADRWTDAVRSEKIESRVSTTNAAVLAAVKRHRPTRVLDLGCGEGWLCRSLSEAGIFCVGIDSSPSLIEAARGVDGKGRYETLNYAQLTENPAAAGNYFDLIVANFSLLDLEMKDLLSALSRISVEGAHLVIQTSHPTAVGGHYKTGWKTETFASFGGGVWVPMPWYFRTLADWSSHLSLSWKLERIEEPSLPGQTVPASLLLTACKGSALRAMWQP